MDISKITDNLYISACLKAGHVNELASRNIHLIISMIGGHRPPEVFTQCPFELLWLQTVDSVFVPIPINMLIQGVQTAMPVIQNGNSVLVYCVQGRHRSVAMAAAILIAMGNTTHEAAGLIQKQRKIADPKAWHIHRQIQKFESCWYNKKGMQRISSYLGEIYSGFFTALVSTVILHYTEIRMVQ